MVFTLELEVPPAKKNTMDIRIQGKKCPCCGKGEKIWPSPNKEVQRAERRIHNQALMSLPAPPSLYGTNDVEVRMQWDVERKRFFVEIEDLGPPPKKNAGRWCDLVNMPAVVLDGLEKAVFHNDRQVRRLLVEKA